MAKKKDILALISCAMYLLDTERDDYEEWCEKEGKDPKNLENNHIYTDALKGMGY